jgi:hypothetical protein
MGKRGKPAMDFLALRAEWGMAGSACDIDGGDRYHRVSVSPGCLGLLPGLRSSSSG